MSAEWDAFALELVEGQPPVLLPVAAFNVTKFAEGRLGFTPARALTPLAWMPGA